MGTNRPRGDRHRFALGLTAVVAGGFALRVAYILVKQDLAPAPDGVYYHLGAQLLADGHGYLNPLNLRPGASHPPGWTTALALPSAAGFRSVLSHQIFGSLVGAATIALVGLAGRAVANARVGLTAAAIAALYPNLWRYERELMSEPLGLLLAAAAVLSSYRYWAEPSRVTGAAVGLTCGLLTLVRSEEILLLGALLLPLVLLAGDLSLGARLGRLAVAGSLAIAALVPWAAYNTARFENAVVLSNGLGTTMRVANCQAVYYGDLLGYWHEGCRRWNLSREDDDSAKDLRWRRHSLEYALSHATRLPVVLAARQGRTWSLFRPFQQMKLDATIYNTPIWVHQLGLFTYWALLPAALAGVIVLRRRRIPVFPLLSFFAVSFVGTAITFGETRYRALAEVPFVILAAVGVDAVSRRIRGISGDPRLDPRLGT